MDSHGEKKLKKLEINGTEVCLDGIGTQASGPTTDDYLVLSVRPEKDLNKARKGPGSI